jgi:acetyl esterase
MPDSADGYLPTGPVDPAAAQVAAFLQADPNWRGLTSRPIAGLRAQLRAATPPSELVVEHVEDFHVPVTGGDVGLRLYRPTARPPAMIVWAHGGGFVLGSIEETDNFARALALRTGCAVVSVGYRLAPEHKFPTAINDLLAATLWIEQRLTDLVGGRIPLLLGGDSAGANLATVVTRKLHETKACRIAGGVLAYPCTDNAQAASLRRFEAPFLNVDEVGWFMDQYLPIPELNNHPDFAPIRSTNLRLLPPTLIITAEHDIITEQAEDYGRRLAAAGVAVRTSRHPGMIHGFLTGDLFFPGEAGAAIREIGDLVGQVTGSE